MGASVTRDSNPMTWFKITSPSPCLYFMLPPCFSHHGFPPRFVHRTPEHGYNPLAITYLCTADCEITKPPRRCYRCGFAIFRGPLKRHLFFASFCRSRQPTRPIKHASVQYRLLDLSPLSGASATTAPWRARRCQDRTLSGLSGSLSGVSAAHHRFDRLHPSARGFVEVLQLDSDAAAAPSVRRLVSVRRVSPNHRRPSPRSHFLCGSLLFLWDWWWLAG